MMPWGLLCFLDAEAPSGNPSQLQPRGPITDGARTHAPLPLPTPSSHHESRYAHYQGNGQPQVMLSPLPSRARACSISSTSIQLMVAPRRCASSGGGTKTPFTGAVVAAPVNRACNADIAAAAAAPPHPHPFIHQEPNPSAK